VNYLTITVCKGVALEPSDCNIGWPLVPATASKVYFPPKEGCVNARVDTWEKRCHRHQIRKVQNTCQGWCVAGSKNQSVSRPVWPCAPTVSHISGVHGVVDRCAHSSTADPATPSFERVNSDTLENLGTKGSDLQWVLVGPAHIRTLCSAMHTVHC
jgi:hypothetical protein